MSKTNSILEVAGLIVFMPVITVIGFASMAIVLPTVLLSGLVLKAIPYR